MNGEFSGGTFKTLIHSIKNPPPKSFLGKLLIIFIKRKYIKF